jgi:hyaluronan synthase
MKSRVESGVGEMRRSGVALLVLVFGCVHVWIALALLGTVEVRGMLSATGFALELTLVAKALAVLVPLSLCVRCALFLMYRPAPSVSDSELPALTVIVPAFNEGEQVYRTLYSLLGSHYPARKLQIIAVNDGSSDDTWSFIKRATSEHPDRIVALNCRVNRGKRAALFEGFERARGDVIVTVDSDSEVLADTLRNLVTPLVSDPRVGAVAGNVRVLNQGQGVIPAMVDVSFTYAFEFMRSSESVLDTVLCCPGALAAYRRSLVDQVKDEWIAQTFMGKPANIGEDRALTNLILERGYLSRFQANAIVLTEVPTQTAKLVRMLLRWGRSGVRETLKLASFAFKRFRPSSALGARLLLTVALLRMASAPFAFGVTAFTVLTQPAVVPLMLVFAAIGSIPYAGLYASCRGTPRALWAFPYALYSFFCLSWITTYALLTPHRNGWLTRQTTPAREARALHGRAAA